MRCLAILSSRLAQLQDVSDLLACSTWLKFWNRACLPRFPINLLEHTFSAMMGPQQHGLRPLLEPALERALVDALGAGFVEALRATMATPPRHTAVRIHTAKCSLFTPTSGEMTCGNVS